MNYVLERKKRRRNKGDLDEEQTKNVHDVKRKDIFKEASREGKECLTFNSMRMKIFVRENGNEEQNHNVI